MSLRFRDSLDKRRNSSPARSYLWYVELPSLTEAKPNSANSLTYATASRIWNESGDRNYNESEMKLLNSLVTEITTPFFNFETDKVVDGSTFWYTAKHNDIGNISITLEEQENGMVYNYLNNWRAMIVNPDGTYNPPHFWKRNIYLHRLNLAKVEFQTFKFTNYFISEVSNLANNYDSNDVVKYQASFTGDALEDPATVSGAELNRIMESVSTELGGIKIDYDRFRFDTQVPSVALAGLLPAIGNRIL